MKEKFRNQSIKDENMRSRCTSTKHRKKESVGGLLFSNGWSVKKVPHFLNVQLRTVLKCCHCSLATLTLLSMVKHNCL